MAWYWFKSDHYSLNNLVMRKSYTFFSILFVLSLASNAQKEKPLALWYEWNDSTAFAMGPKPILENYGPLSDSLSKEYHNKKVLIANNQYYIVNTLADYYLWFIDRYPDLFKGSVDDYYDFYEIQNSLGLCDFVGKNYKGKHFPIPFNQDYEEYVQSDSEPTTNNYDKEKLDAQRRWQQDEVNLKKMTKSRSTSNASTSKSATPKLKKVGSN